MVAVDFTQYSLALIADDRVIYSSRQPGLRPLSVCIETCRPCYRNCTLYDRVIGLAAAKLIVYGNIISRVIAEVASLPAREFLENHQIEIKAAQVVENILTRDRLAVCPGELIALTTDDRELFLAQIKSLLGE